MGANWGSKQEQTETGRRACSRVRLFLPAGIESLLGLQPVELNNLSRTGAMITVTDPLRAGSDVVITCGSIDAVCKVVWTHGNCCGVEFENPVTHEQVLSARQQSDEHPNRQKEARLAAARAWADGRSQSGLGI